MIASLGMLKQACSVVIETCHEVCSTMSYSLSIFFALEDEASVISVLKLILMSQCFPLLVSF